MVQCPDGMVLKFYKDTGVCAGFPYIDLENLEEHVIKSPGTETPQE